MKFRKSCLLLLLVSLLFTVGCGKKSSSSKPKEVHGWFAEKDGWVRFYTNSKEVYGWGFWAWDDIEENPMKIVETSVKKISGNPDYGYGIVFCLRKISEETEFYRLIINTYGYYLVSKKVNVDEWTHDLVDDDNEWNYTDKLYKGYNVENKIKVEYDSTTKTFKIYFNDKYVTSFEDSTFTGGKFGYYASVGQKEEENFPKTPVNILFKQHQPTKTQTKSSQISTHRFEPLFDSASEKARND
ncbi:MAG TPA: hypothetical protein GXZ97_11480 [Hydrogenispora sp.]|nr:hypothetical protein [Hydrogenispora sp.]